MPEMLSESDREMVINYLARERAETAMFHTEDYLADLGWTSDDEEFWYHVYRKEGIPEWKLKPFEEASSEELLDLYLSFYDVDPDEHLMDRFVAGRILQAALA